MVHANADLKGGEDLDVRRGVVLDGVQIAQATEPVIVPLENVNAAVVGVVEDVRSLTAQELLTAAEMGNALHQRYHIATVNPVGWELLVTFAV